MLMQKDCTLLKENRIGYFARPAASCRKITNSFFLSYVKNELVTKIVI